MSIQSEISIVPSAAPLGAEVAGINLSQKVDEATAQQLRTSLAKYRVLVFRDQHIAPEEQIRAMRIFGNVIDESQKGDLYTYVSAGEGSLVKPGRLLFHSDNHFLPEPLEALSLYGEEIQGTAAPTLFVDNVAAYRRLSQELKAKIAEARITTASYYFWGQGGDRTARSIKPDIDEAPHASHPVVWHHPATGEPFVYVTELHARQLENMTLEESEDLLMKLYDTLYVPELMYAHYWRSGDLIVWDNRASQHARGPVPADIDPEAPTRKLRRVVVGTKDFHEQFKLPTSIGVAE